ncbi:tandem-95 repeat protein [Daejeonella lutea]|uniref:Gliding motility-associated C-terminal domain-containing protein n=1 Tax=Daejeonella lutea TaxID=572036 RepID=A0A1T5EEL4_9SPHI|nr:Ig-like domain-containing protein [Daejeonella lutea]SKB82258.1 gliding motility-associated C-terminal domain-containing protein [Daejeonella lutea]
MKVFFTFLLGLIILTAESTFAQFPYTDSFKNSTATGTVVGGGAKLTAGTIDPEGNGYLRLTENTAEQSGFARNTTVFPSDKGLLVTFEYYSYGGQTTETADGICFFLFDATVLNDPADPANGYNNPGFQIGGIGGSLGYAGYNGAPGLRKGFLGIGFDEFGNFATNDGGKKEGSLGVVDKIRQNVTLRGDGYGTSNGAGNYEFLKRIITTTELTPGFNVEGKVDGRTPGFNSSNPGYRKATIEILPNGANSYKINVWIVEGGVATPHHPVVDFIYNATIPPNLSYGLAASTGGFTNLHEVRNIDIVIPPSSAVKPVAVADVSTTSEDTPVTFSIISNDYDANGNYTLNLGSIDLNPSVAGEQKTLTTTDGTYTVNNSGIVTFTPALHFSGAAAAISYTIKDNGSGGVVPIEESLSATINVTVTAVNDAPVATVPTVIEITEDTPKAITGISFSDPDAAGATVVASFSVEAGALTAASGGGVTVSGAATAITLTGTLANINAFIAGGGVNYAPVTNSNVDVILTVGINDNGNVGAGGALSSTKTLILDIQPVNDPPILTSITKSGNEDSIIPFSAADFTSKFSDVDGNSITKVKIVGLPPAAEGVLKKGDVPITAGEEISFADLPSITFTPALNFNGTVAPFSWNAFDGTVYAAVDATINITVNPVNDPPIVNNIDKTVAEDVTMTFTAADFTGKYTDVENNPLVNITIVSLPLNGSLRKSGSPLIAGAVVLASELASLTFVPTTNFNGNTSFLWKASDGNSDAVSNAAVNIVVTPVDDPPVAVNDAASTESGTAVTFSVVANDTDPDGPGTIDITTVDIDPATAGIQTTFVVAGQGTYIANNNGTVTFTPLSNYDSGVGTATPVLYTVKDNTGLTSNSASIAVKVTPKVAPVANADEATTAENVAVTVNILANDTDANGNNTINTATVDLDPSTGGRQNSFTVAGQGSYTVNNAGVVTFTPVQYYNSAPGTATPISYTVNDNSGLTSNAATITITVTSVPDAPVAVADAVTTNEDNSVTFSVIANDFDRDGNSTIDPTSVDFDPGAGVKTSLVVAGEGTYTANPNGTVTFVPVANYNSGVTTATPISYTIKDNTGLTSNAATITVTVNSVNDLPVVSNVPKSGTQGQTVTFTEADFKSKYTDPENSPLTKIRVVSLPQNGTLRLYGASITAGQEIQVTDLEGITFVPVASFNGITSFSWNGNDGAGYAAVNANVVITLSAVNQPPVLTPVIRNYTGNSVVTFAASDFTNQFTDPEGNTLTKIKIETLPTSGKLKLFGVDVIPGQEIPVGDISGLTYVPEPGTSGTYNFTWNGSDGTTYAAATSTVSINVTPTNVPPVVSDIAKSGTGFADITFTTTDFTSKFTDADNNSLVKVKVINLPLNGTLRLNGVNVIAGQEIPLLDLPKLSFQSALNWSGTTSFAWNGFDGQVYAVNNANVTMTVILPVDPNAKIGVAKSLTSISDGVNGTYDVKFTFTLANYGPNALENISLKDNLALAFAGTEFTVKTITATGNLRVNTSFNGNGDTELLLPASRLTGGEERKVELEINVRLVSKSGSFFNYAIGEGTSAITGAKVQDRSTNGLKADPVVNGDVSLSEVTSIDLAPRPTFIPDGFTPNGDGINDNLIIQNTLNQKISLEVFNRWGNRVFRSVDYKNDWSGRCTEGIYLGQDIPDGTYFYVVMVDNKSKYVGSLTVQR